MATEKSIVEALYALEKAVIEANCLGQTLTIPDCSPSWAHLFAYQAERISDSYEVLSLLVRSQVLPLLRDFDAVRGGAKK